MLLVSGWILCSLSVCPGFPVRRRRGLPCTRKEDALRPSSPFSEDASPWTGASSTRPAVPSSSRGSAPAARRPTNTGGPTRRWVGPWASDKRRSRWHGTSFLALCCELHEHGVPEHLHAAAFARTDAGNAAFFEGSDKRTPARSGTGGAPADLLTFWRGETCDRHKNTTFGNSWIRITPAGWTRPSSCFIVWTHESAFYFRFWFLSEITLRTSTGISSATFTPETTLRLSTFQTTEFK